MNWIILRLAKRLRDDYLGPVSFGFSIPTKSTASPTPRTGFTRSSTTAIGSGWSATATCAPDYQGGGYNWTSRYRWIVEAALKNRVKRFVIDGEAVDGARPVLAWCSTKFEFVVNLKAAKEIGLLSRAVQASARSGATSRGVLQTDISSWPFAILQRGAISVAIGE
jgi:hypothetical protein